MNIQNTTSPVPELGVALPEIELGPTHGDYGAFWPFAGVPLGVHELKIIEVHEWLSAVARRPDGNFEEGWHVCEVPRRSSDLPRRGSGST